MSVWPCIKISCNVSHSGPGSIPGVHCQPCRPFIRDLANFNQLVDKSMTIDKACYCYHKIAGVETGPGPESLVISRWFLAAGNGYYMLRYFESFEGTGAL